MVGVVDLFFNADDIISVMKSELSFCSQKKTIQSSSDCTENYAAAKIVYPKVSSGCLFTNLGNTMLL